MGWALITASLGLGALCDLQRVAIVRGRRLGGRRLRDFTMVLGTLIGGIGVWMLARRGTASTLLVFAVLPAAVQFVPGVKSSRRDRFVTAMFAAAITAEVAFHVLPQGR